MAGSVRAPSGQIEPTAYYEPGQVTARTEATQEDAKAKRQDHREETPDREEKSSDAGGSTSEVRFKVQEGAKGPVIQFVDSETGDVTRQVPTEDVLKAAKKLGALAGLFFEKEG